MGIYIYTPYIYVYNDYIVIQWNLSPKLYSGFVEKNVTTCHQFSGDFGVPVEEGDTAVSAFRHINRRFQAN